MVRLLLDSHSMVWLDNALAMRPSAMLAIGEAQQSQTLYISPITAWEIGVAAGKKRLSSRPPLRGLLPDVWFDLALRSARAKLVSFTTPIALEASKVPALYGSGDPGDCFLIATAHIRKLTLVTRDKRILNFATTNPHYLSVLSC